MNLVRIKEPIWATKSVGIAEDILDRTNETYVEILYTNIRGWRIWPYLYVISREKAMKYPIQRVKGRTLRIIPIAALTEKENLCLNQKTKESKSNEPVSTNHEKDVPQNLRLF